MSNQSPLRQELDSSLLNFSLPTYAPNSIRDEMKNDSEFIKARTSIIEAFLKCLPQEYNGGGDRTQAFGYFQAIEDVEQLLLEAKGTNNDNN